MLSPRSRSFSTLADTQQQSSSQLNRESTSRPVPRTQSSLGVTCITIADDDYYGEESRRLTGLSASTTEPHSILSDGLLFVEKPKPAPHALVEFTTLVNSEKTHANGFPGKWWTCCRR